MSMALARAVYDRSPVWVQNLLLSGYGLKLYRARYGGKFKEYSAQLQRSERYSAEQFRELQLAELRGLLAQAGQHVPWYRRMFAERGIRPAEIDLDSFAQRLPMLTKDEVRQHATDLLAENFDPKTLVETNTSGTSGTPLTIKATREALQKNYAFFERFLSSAGVHGRDRSATFAGRILLPLDQKGPPYWRRNWVMNTTLLSSYHISPSTAGDYLAELERYQPVFIDSYPSAVYALAQHLGQRDRQRLKLKAVVTSSETLLAHQRALIEEVFGCPVFDHYGSAEMAAWITQCEHGNYHVNPEYGLVEVIRADGQPATPGETGELVCTGFLNPAMPLIRYRTGDSAVLGDGPCACGRASPILKSIEGRVDDMIVTVDGRQVGRLDPLFKGLSNIKETQIAQVARDRIVIRVVPDTGYTEAIGAELVAALKVRVGQDMRVDLERHERIPRTAAGKFRAVVSEVGRR